MKIRDLKENQSTFYYQTYLGQEDEVDEDGNLTGGKTDVFANPVKAVATVSARGVKGTSTMATETQDPSPFGSDVNYDRAISTVQDLPINEYSRLFIEVTPELNDDGSLATDEHGNIKTPPDYFCTLPAHGLYQNVWSIKKIKAAQK